MNACCNGCSVPSGAATPSMVITSCPATWTAAVRHDTTAVDVHRAGAALPLIAPLLGSSQHETLAEHVEQGLARIHGEAHILAVDGEGRLDTVSRRPGGRRFLHHGFVILSDRAPTKGKSETGSDFPADCGDESPKVARIRGSHLPMSQEPSRSWTTTPHDSSVGAKSCSAIRWVPDLLTSPGVCRIRLRSC